MLNKVLCQDFRARLLALLGGPFRGFPPALALSLLDPKLTYGEAETRVGLENRSIVRRADGCELSPYDMKRLNVRHYVAWCLSNGLEYM